MFVQLPDWIDTGCSRAVDVDSDAVDPRVATHNVSGDAKGFERLQHNSTMIAIENGTAVILGRWADGQNRVIARLRMANCSSRVNG